MTTTHPVVTTPHLLRTLATPLVAMAAAAAGWGLARLLAVDLLVGSGSGRRVVGLADVLVVALLAAVLGSVAHRVLRRLTRRPAAWPVVAGTVLLVSLAGPAGAAGLGAGLLLATMHVAVGLVVILGQPRTDPGRR